MDQYHVRPCFVAVTLPSALKLRVFAATATMVPVICCDSMQVLVPQIYPVWFLITSLVQLVASCTCCQPTVFVAHVSLRGMLVCYVSKSCMTVPACTVPCVWTVACVLWFGACVRSTPLEAQMWGMNSAWLVKKTGEESKSIACQRKVFV